MAFEIQPLFVTRPLDSLVHTTDGKATTPTQ